MSWHFRSLSISALLLAFFWGAYFSPLLSGFVSDVWVSLPVAGETTPKTASGRGFRSDFVPSSPDTTLLQEVYDLVRKNYIATSKLSQEEVSRSLVRGFVEGLWDRHTEYFDPEETKQFNEMLSGDFEGIGAVVDANKFGVRVERVLAGSPAKLADLRAGDVIARVDSGSVAGLSVTDAVKKIRGPIGTTVRLEVLREGESSVLQKTIKRDKVVLPSVTTVALPDHPEIGYVAVSIFGEETAKDFTEQYGKLARDPKTRAIVLDLRDNGGGYLETAVRMLSELLEKDRLLVVTKYRSPTPDERYFSKGNDLPSMPLVVLVNENSASASEITAGALQDYGRAVVVGAKTYGKGSVQSPYFLSDGSEVKITTALWYTPKGRGIDHVGVDPDVVVAFQKEDYANRFDRQLDAAVRVAKDLAEHPSDRTGVILRHAPVPTSGTGVVGT